MEQEIVSFHERARKAFFAIFARFQQSATRLNRRTDENVFQQMCGMYGGQLQQNLQGIALEVIGGAATPGSRNQLRQTLTAIIDDYVQEFLQKVRSL